MKKFKGDHAREEYKKRWHEHIRELNGLKWNLDLNKPEGKSQWDRLDKLMTELTDLVDEAAENVKELKISF